MKKLTGQVAVVTGASKGIGASIAKHLADEGAAVIVNYASSKKAADHVVADIKERDGKAVDGKRDRRQIRHADLDEEPDRAPDDARQEPDQDQEYGRGLPRPILRSRR